MLLGSKKSPLKVICCFLAFSVAGSLPASDRIDLSRNKTLITQLNQTALIGLSNDALALAMGLSDREELLEIRRHEHENGEVHIRYRQTYMGSPVWGEQVVVSVNKQGRIKVSAGA